MCGIIGYIGNNGTKSDLIIGLKALEYRGYDSAGIAYYNNEQVMIDKAVGKIKALEDIVVDGDILLGIGHTRWATHGKPTQINAHPHHQKQITLVHNGIIENYASLKEELIEQGYNFASDTDTEVGAAYIDYVYQNLKDPVSTLNKCQQVFKGSYALAIIFEDDLDHLYAMRNNCPLIIGVSAEGNMIASDMIAIKHKTNQYILLDNLNIAKLSIDKIEIYQNMKLIDYQVKTMDLNDDAITKAGYDHYMLKEINEIPQIIETNLASEFTLPIDLDQYTQIDIVACGSAYYAGLVGKYLLEENVDIAVTCHLASEYRYQKNWWHPQKLVIVISQSGETADTLAALELANKHVDTLAIVNAPNSSIAREAKYVLHTEAGYEIAVATTKAYVAQVLMFVRMIKQLTSVDTDELKNIVQKVINYDDYQNIAKLLEAKEHNFFIGRKIDYALALEGSLKLKEISYIHSETYAAGELKHGTISLIEEGTPVIAVITDLSVADKTISNIKEVKARGAYVIAIVNDKVEISDDAYDHLLVVPYLNEVCNPIITVVTLQLIAYYTAKLKGCDIDQPRNLAKSVTVE